MRSPDSPNPEDAQLFQEWRAKIKIADRHNIFSHCRTCDAEWVDSSWGVPCHQCGSIEIEQISCWQFPDD